MFIDPARRPGFINLINPYDNKKLITLFFDSVVPTGQLVYKRCYEDFKDVNVFVIFATYDVIRGIWNVSAYYEKGESERILDPGVRSGAGWQNNPQTQLFLMCSEFGNLVAKCTIQDLIMKSGVDYEQA